MYFILPEGINRIAQTYFHYCLFLAFQFLPFRSFSFNPLFLFFLFLPFPFLISLYLILFYLFYFQFTFSPLGLVSWFFQSSIACSIVSSYISNVGLHSSSHLAPLVYSFINIWWGSKTTYSVQSHSQLDAWTYPWLDEQVILTSGRCLNRFFLQMAQLCYL